jgi:acetolactate decarboxylase
MKHTFISTLFITLGLHVMTANAANQPVFQVATIGSLTQGVYDGDYTYGNLMKHGDFGLGTFLDLNGEMVAIDGSYYQIEANGKLKSVRTSQIVPFAEVTFFHPEMQKTLSAIHDYQQLGKTLNAYFGNKNIPHAIRIDGTFKSLTLRSLRKQKKPYPLLTKASSEQAIFHLNNVEGSIVGFWFPKYWAGIAVPGLHLHFVTKDRSTGGHVLEIELDKNAQVSLQSLQTVEVYLPATASFAKTNLSDENLQHSIKKAEGGSE